MSLDLIAYRESLKWHRQAPAGESSATVRTPAEVKDITTRRARRATEKATSCSLSLIVPIMLQVVVASQWNLEICTITVAD
jgi:hypothetical protein